MPLIKEYKKSMHDEVIDYVGIAADEPSRFDKAKADGKRVPLVEWGMTENDCLRYCYSRGFFWEEDGVRLYDILDRVSCWCCKNKNIKELRNIYWSLPEYWNRLKWLQQNIDAPMKGSGNSVFDLERRFLLEKEWLNAGKKINTKSFYKQIKEKRNGI